MSSGFPDVLPEMNLQKSNGEVSASIEETNRVRALLGLKPLHVGPSSHSHSKHTTQKPNKDKDPNNPNQKEIDPESIEKLHSKLAAKHRYKTSIRGISLSDDLAQNSIENYSAADWVQKSRELEKVHKTQKKAFDSHINELFAEESAEMETETEADMKHLKGKIVNHDLNSFKKGETKILILKDSRILDAKMNINRGEDELINVEMYESELRQNKCKERELSAQNRKYDPFNEEMSDTLLPQYNQKRDVTKNRNAFVLDESGTVRSEAQIMAVLKDDTEMGPTKQKFTAYDLSDLNHKTTVESDYIVRFKKKKRKKKAKKKRKRETSASDMMGVSAKKRKLESIPCELEQESKDKKYAFLDGNDNGHSRGKRDEILTQLRLSESEQKRERARMSRYNNALDKANKSMRENLELNAILNELNECSDDDQMFTNALQRAEILKQKKKTFEISTSVNDGTLTETDKIFAKNESLLAKDGSKSRATKDSGDIIVNITTHSINGLKDAMHEMKENNEIIIAQKQSQRNVSEYDSENAVIVSSDKMELDSDNNGETNDGGWVECDGTNEGKTVDKKSKDNSGEANDGSAEVLDQAILEKEPLVGNSMAETMAHIKRRGYLQNEDISLGVTKAKAGMDKQKQERVKKWTVEMVLKWLKKSDSYIYQRYKDKFLLKRIDGSQLLNSCTSKLFLRGVIGFKESGYDINKFMRILGELCGDPAPDINLSYNDDFGKPMSKKEAFRKLSHKFHGKKSGPKKEEKRIKKRKLELQRKIQNNVDTPLQTLSKLKQTTQSLNKPFVEVDKI